MKIVDNRTVKAADILSSNVKPDDTLDAMTGDVSLYAFDEMASTFSNLAGLRLLLSSTSPEQGDFALLGEKGESIFRNRLNQQHLAGKVHDFLAEKAEIRRLLPGSTLPDWSLFKSESFLLWGTLGFTAAGLGCVPAERQSVASATETALEMTVLSPQLSGAFDARWCDPSQSRDEKARFLARLADIAADKSPAFAYEFILSHLFRGSGEDALDDASLADGRHDLRDHAIWSTLFKFQKDGVLGAIEKLRKYNGCIIADSVGLGKTYEALAIIKYYELQGRRVLVLCPRRLRDNWTIYCQNDRSNPFADDLFRYDVLNHTDLSRETGKSGDIDLATCNWDNYDLVVIDESHNFRNNAVSKNARRLSRYQFLMQRILQSGVKTQVLMLSATPVNNRFADLRNQFSLITAGEDNTFANEGVPSMSAVLSSAQRAFNAWQDDRAHNPKDLMAALGFEYFKLLDMLTIARSRGHVERYYGTGDVGKFPTRRKPVNIAADFDTAGEFPDISKINDIILRLHLATFSLLRYVLADRMGSYSRKYDMAVGKGGVFKQLDREESLVALMRTNLLKRLESSVHSFRKTLQTLLRAAESLDSRLAAAHASGAAEDGETPDINDLDIESADLADQLAGSKVKVLLADCDLLRWRHELAQDLADIRQLIAWADLVTPERDKKLAELRKLLADKAANPFNTGNRKAIVFTAFADTAAYLYDNLAPWAEETLGMRSALVVGTGANKTNYPGAGRRTDPSTLLLHFSPVSKHREKAAPDAAGEIDLLIATDCVSEGQNLQDADLLVNYDIHWNPVRIIQRFGRIDRIGSKNDSIQLVDFWPNLDLDSYIDLYRRVTGRMVIANISAAGEGYVIDDSKRLNDELDYRKRQLDELKNKVVDLESFTGGISITDLTLTDFRLDLAAALRSSDKAIRDTPIGLRAEVPAAPDRGLPKGALFCLRDVRPGASREVAATANPLAPHYLVLVSSDGTVVTGPDHVRIALDALRASCRGQAEPVAEAVATFNRATAAGARMGAYTKLLEKAAEAIRGSQEADGIQTLFRPGGVHLATADASGAAADGFEVVAFLPIV